MKVLKTSLVQVVRVVTDIGEFRVWDHGSIDMWNDDQMDWLNIPEEITAEQEQEIRQAAFKFMIDL